MGKENESVDRIRPWPLTNRVVRPATIASLTVPGCGKFATRGLPREQRMISGPRDPRLTNRDIRCPGVPVSVYLMNTEGGQLRIHAFVQRFRLIRASAYVRSIVFWQGNDSVWTRSKGMIAVRETAVSITENIFFLFFFLINFFNK